MNEISTHLLNQVDYDIKYVVKYVGITGVHSLMSFHELQHQAIDDKFSASWEATQILFGLFLLTVSLAPPPTTTTAVGAQGGC